MKRSFVTMLGVVSLLAVAPALAATSGTEPPARQSAQSGPAGQQQLPDAMIGHGMMQGGMGGGVAMPMQNGAMPMQQGRGGMMQWGQDAGMPGYGAMPGYGMMQGYGMVQDTGMMSMMGMLGGPDGMVRHIEGRIAFIKAELQITEEQEQRWVVFADALRANAAAMNASMRQLMTTGSTVMPLPGQLEQYERILAARVEGLRKTRAALLPLYAVLTETQRQTADNMFLGPLGM